MPKAYGICATNKCKREVQTVEEQGGRFVRIDDDLALTPVGQNAIVIYPKQLGLDTTAELRKRVMLVCVEARNDSNVVIYNPFDDKGILTCECDNSGEAYNVTFTNKSSSSMTCAVKLLFYVAN